MWFLQEDSMNEQEIKEQLCDVCHKMWQLGWVAANDGNVSVKLEDGTFFATPTGMSKSFITPDKLVRINDKGEVLEGAAGLRPSSEIKMHLCCYRERPDVGAVLHAHPPVATGYAVANKALDEYTMIESVIAIGSVPVTPYGTPSTDEVPEAIKPYLQEHDVMLLQNHGAPDGGSRPDHCILPHGNAGTLCKDLPECPPAGRCTGDLAGEHRPALQHACTVRRNGKASRL